MVNRRYLRRALFFATLLEGILASVSLWLIYEGGIHPGGAFFAVLHLPSSIVFGSIAKGLDSGEVFFMVLTVISQFLLFALTVYWLQRIFLDKRTL